MWNQADYSPDTFHFREGRHMQNAIFIRFRTIKKIDIGGCALATVITYFLCNIRRSGAFPGLVYSQRVHRYFIALCYFAFYTVFNSLKMANENSSSVASLASRLKYLNTKNQFKWYGDFKDLICLVKQDITRVYGRRLYLRRTSP